ncbi:MAG: hypothetical protein V4689_17675 [Verrucomicrobiota bacterium]
MYLPPSKTLLLCLTFLCANSAQAVTAFSEKFSSTLKPARWSLQSEGSGKLAISKGKLSFTVPTTPKDEEFTFLTLKRPQLKYGENWEVIVDVANLSVPGGSIGVGLRIENAADRTDGVSIELDRVGENASKVTGVFITDDDDDLARDIDEPVSGTKASLRATFSAKTKLITFWYRNSTKAAWEKLANFSPANSASAQRRGDWGMTPATGKFKVVLFAYTEEKFATAGKVTLDNLIIR